MNEALRLDYLQAMGVDSYVPRFVLEGAASSPLCDLGLPLADDEGDGLNDSTNIGDIDNEYQRQSAYQDGEGSEPISPSGSGESRSRIAIDLEGLDVTGKPSRQAINSKKNNNNEGEVESLGPQLNPSFQVDIVGTGIGLLFVVDATLAPLAPAEKRLLANIATAVKSYHQVETPLSFSSDHFRWPVAKNFGLPQGEVAAKDALLGNIMAHAERQHAQYVVVFGEEIYPYFDHAMLSSASLTVISSSMPSEMINNGGLKATLWQQLRGCKLTIQDTE